MKTRLRFVLSLAALAAVPKDLFAADAAHPVVVELFQSQGCSDCPPAVANAAGATTDFAVAFPEGKPES